MLYKSVHDYKRLYMVVHCTWLYMIVQSCKLLSKSMYIVYKVVHGCASFFIIVQGCISLYKFVHHCSMLYKVVHGRKCFIWGTWFYMVVQGYTWLCKVLYGCPRLYIVVQYKVIHCFTRWHMVVQYYSIFHIIVQICKFYNSAVDQNCFLQHLNPTLNTRDSKRGNRHWRGDEHWGGAHIS